VNAQGHYLTRYGVRSSQLARLQAPSANVPPKVTTSLDFKPNLPGGAEAMPAQDANGNPINIFDPKDSTTYSESFSYSVYDSLGNSHEISQYFVKRPANAGGESVWDVYYMEGSTPLSPAKATLTFNGAGVLTSPTPATVNLTLANPGGNASPADELGFDVRYTGTTQFGGEFAKGKPYQDGYATGEYAGMNIDKDGTMVASYTNGVTQRLGSLVLADFSNLQGLSPVGGNAWAETG